MYDRFAKDADKKDLHDLAEKLQGCFANEDS